MTPFSFPIQAIPISKRDVDTSSTADVKLWWIATALFVLIACTAFPICAMSRDEANKQLLDAAHYGNVDAVQAALDAGANVDCKGQGGYTPLFRAMAQRHNRIATKLLQYGAAPDVVTDFGSTPLHMAAFLGDVEGMELLLDYGASVEVRNDSGSTPFHNAVVSMNCCPSARWENLIKLLIFHCKKMVITDQQTGQKCAIPTYEVRNNKGKTPYDIAFSRIKHLFENPEGTYREALEQQHQLRHSMLKKVCGKVPMASWLCNREIGLN